MTKTCHLLASFFDQKAPFLDQKCRFGVLIKKREQMMETRRNEKKKILFFRISLFVGADFWRRGAKAKHFNLFGSAPLFPRGVFSRPRNPCRSPCLGPTPSTDEKRQLKDDKPGIPMIGSKVALAFHSGYRRPQNCFSVCTRGKIQNAFLVL